MDIVGIIGNMLYYLACSMHTAITISTGYTLFFVAVYIIDKYTYHSGIIKTWLMACSHGIHCTCEGRMHIACSVWCYWVSMKQHSDNMWFKGARQTEMWAVGSGLQIGWTLGEWECFNQHASRSKTVYYWIVFKLSHVFHFQIWLHWHALIVPLYF